MTLTVSVVVPALDEARALPGLLALLARLDVAEVIVADGGSRDGTVAIAEAHGARVVQGTRGRGPQQNAGAEQARGEVLWFVHADVRPPDGAVDAIRRALDDPRVVGGAFRIRTVPSGGAVPLGPLLRVADLRSRFTRLPYGDQAMFARAEAFRAVSGFPAARMFEDVELARRLWLRGRLVTLREEVEVSGRRFEARPLASLLAMNALPTLHRLGVPERWLLRLYPPVR